MQGTWCWGHVTAWQRGVGGGGLSLAPGRRLGAGLKRVQLSVCFCVGFFLLRKKTFFPIAGVFEIPLK